MTNTVTNDSYIGKTVNYKRRMEQHKQTPCNKYLRFAYDRYGRDAFTFEILKECPDEILLEEELKYIQDLKPAYNLHKTGKSYGKHAYKAPLPQSDS